MGMKVLILLSLAAICLANGPKGRSGFAFPGQPRGQNGSHTLIWNDYGDIVQRNAEAESQQSKQVSSEEKFVLRNPNRRDVISGNILAPELQGSPEESSQGNEPLFTDNAAPVLEKENSSSEESNASETERKESSSSEQSSESVAVNNQQGSSSSEENSASAAKEEVSEISETNTAAVNQEKPSSEENPAEAGAIKESSASSNDSNNKDETPSSNSESGQNTPDNEDAKATVVSKSEKLAAKLGLQPFVVANSPKKRQIVFNLRDADGLRPPPSRKATFLGPRAVRGIETNLFDFTLKHDSKIVRPHVQGRTQNRFRRPVKK